MKIILLILLFSVSVNCWGKERWLDTKEGSIRNITRKDNVISLREWVGWKGCNPSLYADDIANSEVSFPIKDWVSIKEAIESLINIDKSKSLELRIEKLEKENSLQHTGFPHECPKCEWYYEQGYRLDDFGNTIKPKEKDDEEFLLKCPDCSDKSSVGSWHQCK